MAEYFSSNSKKKKKTSALPSPTPPAPFTQPEQNFSSGGGGGKKNNIGDFTKPTKVTRNPNGTYTYEIGGEIFTLTEEDYRLAEGTSGGKGGTLTPDILRIRELDKQKQADISMREGASAAATVQGLLEAEAGRRGTKPITMEDINQQILIKKAERLESVMSTRQAMEVEKAQAMEADTRGGVVGKTIRTFHEGGKEQVAKGMPWVLGQIGELYDLAKGKFKNKPISITNAEDSFSEAEQAIKDDIDLVKLGAVDYVDALSNLELAQQAVSNLQSSVKGLGSINIRNWIDKGFNFEVSLKQEEVRLYNLKQDLINAYNSQRLSAAQATYGQ